MQGLTSAGVAFERDTDGTLRVQARSRDVGDLLVAFHDQEITVYIDDLTHCHFTPGACDDPEASDPVGEAVSQAVDYVRGVLDDKWVLWRDPSGAGGCYLLGGEENPMDDAPLDEDAQCFLWSGPYKRDGAA
jgi:hypothetical protein